MKRTKKMATYLYIVIATFVVIDLALVYKFRFNLLGKAYENISGCNVNLLNQNNADMGDCFYTFGGGSLSNEVARLANELSSQARILCRPADQSPEYNYFLTTNRYSVKKNNQTCLDSAIFSLFPNHTQQPLTQIASSTNSYDNYQCVGFVQTIISGIYGKPLNRGGDARNFITNVPSGYRYIDKNQTNAKIESGDIALWDDGVNGHIAIVLARSDTQHGSYRFKVAEANWQHPGYINNNRWESSDFPDFKGWLRKT